MDSPHLLAATVETALNAYLGLDPPARARLGELDGRIIALALRGLDLTLYLLPHAQGVQVQTRCETPPDTVIRATPMALARLSLTGQGDVNVINPDIQLEGDTHVGQVMQQALGGVQIDWEEMLSQILGDLSAHKIGNGLRETRAWATRTQQALRMDISEYLQEEGRHLPPRAELEHFYDAVDALRSGVDRCEARIKRLQTHLSQDKDSTQ